MYKQFVLLKCIAQSRSNHYGEMELGFTHYTIMAAAMHSPQDNGIKEWQGE